MDFRQLSAPTPSTPPVPVGEGRSSAPSKVTGRLKTALNLMVWQGKTRKEAAAEAGITDHGMYTALRKPHVRQYLASEMQVLRDSERPRNIHALVDVRDASGNAMARVQAVKALEQLSDQEDSARVTQRSPGLTIVIEGNATVSSRAPDVRGDGNASDIND